MSECRAIILIRALATAPCIAAFGVTHDDIADVRVIVEIDNSFSINNNCQHLFMFVLLGIIFLTFLLMFLYHRNLLFLSLVLGMLLSPCFAHKRHYACYTSLCH